MSDTDTGATQGPAATDGAAAQQTAADRGAATTASTDAVRAGAQTGDPYRPGDTSDYSLTVDAGESSEATVSNLYQAVPAELEGTEAQQPDGLEPSADQPADTGPGDGSGDGSGTGAGDGGAPTIGSVQFTQAEVSGDPASSGTAAPDAGLLDAALQTFAAGGEAIEAVADAVGAGAGTGGLPDTDLPLVNTVLGPVADIDGTPNQFDEDAAAGTVVGLTAFASETDPGDTVVYSIDDDRFDIDSTTGVVTIADGASFDAETEPSVTVVVTATSSDGSSSTADFVFVVGDVNEDDVGPVSDVDATDNAFSEDVAAGSTVGLTAFADDPDVSDTVTYTIDDARFVIDPNTGVVTVADGAVFDAESEASVDVVVTATSTDGSQSSQTFSFTVTDVDEFDVGPVSDVDASDNTVAENSAGGTVVGVTAFASDADASDTVTYSITDARFVIDPNTGVVTVADGAVLDAETTPTIDLEVTATSTDGSTSTATFTITISDENEFGISPVTDVDATDNTVAENSAGGTVVGVTAFASDADASDTVTYSITDARFVIDPNTGVVTVADGAVLDAETTPTIDLEVTATSTDGSTSTATFTITISDENEFGISPVTDVDATDNTVAENSAGGTVVGVTAFASDADASDTVTYSITDARFVIDPNTGVVTVADGAVLDAETTPTIDLEVTATSTDGSTSTATFTITVSDENEFGISPVTDVDAADNTVAENSAGGTVVGVTAFASDADASDTVTYSITDARFVIDPDTGVVTVADGAVLDAETTPTIDLEVTATSTDGSTSTATFTITISDENEFGISPVTDVDAADNTVAENSAGGTVVGVTAFASDADASDTVTYSITDARFVIDPDTGVVTVADGAVLDAETTPTIDLEVTATSTDGSTSTATFTITISDENEFGITPVTDVDAADNTVAENSAGGTVVGVTAFASDADASDTVTYSITDARFVIDPNTGVVTVADGAVLDAETTPTIDLEVTATSTDGSTSTATFTITISDENEFGITPVTDVDAADNTVAENSAGGTVVGVTAFASDADASDTVTYSITDARFVIDPNTGVVTVADGAILDAETTPTIDLEVTATSTDGSTSTATFTITISDENEFGISPVTDVDATDNTVAENSAGGTVVGVTAFASDADASDTVTYSITDARFVIDPNTGVVTVADGAVLDAETTPTIDLEVTATSTDGSTSTATFTITVEDGYDAPDLIVEYPDGNREFMVNGSFEVYSGALTGTDGSGWYQNPDSIEGWTYDNVDVHQAGHNNFGATDGEHHLDLASFTNGTASQVIEGQLDGHVYTLSMDLKSRGAIGESVANIYWNGELIATVDPAETGVDWQNFTFDIIGGSGDGSNTLTFVEVGSDNNGGTLVDSVSIRSGSTINVAEEYAGAEIAPLTVVDPDVGDTHTFTVSDARFEVVVDGGRYLLKLKDGEAFDYETETSVPITVTVTDSTGLTDTEVVNVNVIDVDEAGAPVGPVSDIDAGANAVAENSAGGTFVGVTAFANDATASDTVTYSITDARFVIDANTGVVTVADGAVLDAETTPTIDLEVTATSTDGSTSTATFTITISDENEFGIGAVTDADATANAIASDDAAGTSVGITGFAVDPDATDTVTYSIDDPRFEIDPVTGEVTIAEGAVFDPGGEPVITVSITATSTDGSSSSSSFDIQVQEPNAPPDLIVGEAASRHNYIQNGSFENFTSSGKESGSGDAIWYGDASVNSWVTVNTDIHSSGWDNNLGTTDGDHRLDLADDHQNGFAYQDVQGIETGQSYTLSVDMRHRGDAGDAVVEVYWAGQLVARIEPSLDGDGWHTYEFEVVGGSGDGNNRLEFREVGDSNFKGTQIDNVVLTDSDGLAIVENDAGANIVALSVVDPNAGDTHTFSVSDDRFEVVVHNGQYMLKLKDGVALDYETETSVTVDITVTDSGGLSDTETVTVRVIDVMDDAVIYGTEEFIYVGETGLLDASNVLSLNQGFEVQVFGLVGGVLTLGALADIATLGGEIGVVGSVTGLLDGNQIGYDPFYGESERFSVSFYEDVSEATLSVSNFYSDILGLDREVGHWYAYNDGEFVSAGTFLGTLDGTSTIDIDAGALFDQIIFTADVDTLGLGGSDFSITELAYTDADLTIGGNDTLTGTEGNDTIYGLSGQDTIYGLSGDDLIIGGTRDDILFGGDGNDVFRYSIGDGNDTITGGAGDSWIDVIDLQDGAAPLGTYGADWTVTMTSGTIDNVDMAGGSITLSDDAAGYIDLNDGSRIDFTEIESIQF